MMTLTSDPAVVQVWEEILGSSPPRLDSAVARAACAILWMGLRGEKEGLSSMLATTFAEAAGLDGRQKWGLVLSSSARVSQVTYQTVIGVRYPELVTHTKGRTLGDTNDKPLRGGLLPVFWDVPRADGHAVGDIGAVVEWLSDLQTFQADAKPSLAVLHNRNTMVNLFRASNWVTESKNAIVSRSVTTCAGMTAHTVIVAQTRVGFLTGGRRKSFLSLSPAGRADCPVGGGLYGRATVAIIRARSLCLIMGPLDMKGLLGADGNSHVWCWTCLGGPC